MVNEMAPQASRHFSQNPFQSQSGWLNPSKCCCATLLNTEAYTTTTTSAKPHDFWSCSSTLRNIQALIAAERLPRCAVSQLKGPQSEHGKEPERLKWMLRDQLRQSAKLQAALKTSKYFKAPIKLLTTTRLTQRLCCSKLPAQTKARRARLGRRLS